jgi:Lrp/AsnC family leucine-responsive transcriptional regulator
MNDIKLDKTDLKILHMIENNSRISIKEIATANYMSSPGVSARIHRLEEIGLIKSYYTEIDYSLLGYNIKAFINLEVNPKDKVTFYPYIKKIPNVVECSCVTGDYSMLLKVLFRKPEELDHFINELQQFGRTKTLIAFSTPVDHHPLPLEDMLNVE